MIYYNIYVYTNTYIPENCWSKLAWDKRKLTGLNNGPTTAGISESLIIGEQIQSNARKELHIFV
jgi:hypothetical protein